MKMENKFNVWCAGMVCALLAGCATTQHKIAPVKDISTQSSTAMVKNSAATQRIADGRPPTHVVQKGETLYSIALEFGLDYRDLAQWNHIADINHIKAGQTLHLAAATTPAANPSISATANADNATQSMPLTEQAVTTQAITTQQAITATPTITQPQAVKQPYSEAALAQVQQADVSVDTIIPTAIPPASPEGAHDNVTGNEGDIKWAWPTHGQLLAASNDTAGKGIDIGGQRGQPIVAAAAGKVVYSGSGLHGYGNLVIIKHNGMYLTAYAHNQQVVVKEGQVVTQGQKIAEMGDSDASQVELHFEIRQMGKPVDPLKYLPAQNPK